MNKTTPKKIMEIIFIFVLPLLFILMNTTFGKNVNESSYTDGSYSGTSYFVEYDSSFSYGDSPIRKVLELTFETLGVDSSSVVVNIIVDYTNLWFTMFIIWHLLYLFFDTIMHKVLLRKE